MSEEQWCRQRTHVASIILTKRWLSELIRFSVPNRSLRDDLDQGVVLLKKRFSASLAAVALIFSLLS